MDTQPALDDNPDANAGTTTWLQSLGAQWDCSSFGSSFPQGDDPNTPSQSDAIIQCVSTRALPELYSTGVLAMVTFQSIGFGREALTFGSDTSVSGEAEYHTCDGSSPFAIPCLGATIVKSDCDCYLEDNKGQGTSLCIAGANWKFSWPDGSVSGSSGVTHMGSMTLVFGRAQGLWLFGKLTCPSGPGNASAIGLSGGRLRILRLVDTTPTD